MWTMEELLDRVREALADEYPGAPNGRVRELPDRRSVRWYTTTGLVDRPAAMRGRTALYGPRHLLQVVAVKRRQAQGHTLAAIQAELAGADDGDLAEIARVPAGLLDPGAAATAAETGQVRPRFWTAPAAPAPAAPAARAGSAARVVQQAPTGRARPQAPAAPIRPPDPDPPFALREAGAVDLGGGAFLLLPVRPTDRDLTDLAETVQPLIALLQARGLLTDGSPQ